MKREIEDGEMCPECEQTFIANISRPGMEEVVWAGLHYHAVCLRAAKREDALRAQDAAAQYDR